MVQISDICGTYSGRPQYIDGAFVCSQRFVWCRIHYSYINWLIFHGRILHYDQIRNSEVITFSWFYIHFKIFMYENFPEKAYRSRQAMYVILLPYCQTRLEMTRPERFTGDDKHPAMAFVPNRWRTLRAQPVEI